MLLGQGRAMVPAVLGQGTRPMTTFLPGSPDSGGDGSDLSTCVLTLHPLLTGGHMRGTVLGLPLLVGVEWAALAPGCGQEQASWCRRRWSCLSGPCRTSGPGKEVELRPVPCAGWARGWGFFLKGGLAGAMGLHSGRESWVGLGVKRRGREVGPASCVQTG